MEALNGVGSIDPKPKMEALKRHDKPKHKNISQLNIHRDEVEECRVIEKIVAINKMEYPVFPISPTILANTSLFFNKIEEDYICLICKFIHWMNPYENI